MSVFKPFADDRSTLAIEAFNAENGLQSIALYGNLDISRDQAGLARARELETLVRGIVETLAAIADLPAKIPEQPQTGGQTVKNPFA